MFQLKKTPKGYKFWASKKDLEYLSDALDLALGMEFDEQAYEMLRLINKKLDRQTRTFQ